jgi:spermidine/putrescine transport system permease protein
MRERTAADLLLMTYIGLFFLYLFLPLLMVAVAAFNDFTHPSVIPWQGFTLRWFHQLVRDERLMQGLVNSLLIAAAVTAVAVPMGLAGGLLIARGMSSPKGASLLYAALMSPILMPGLIIGIASLVLWRQLGVPGGFFTAGAAQTSFVASYVMLMVLARLARQDHSLEEAALDLGASPWLILRRVLLPYLAPTLITASLLAFLQSFENYNTTVFAIGGKHTLVTEIGSRLRFGLTPAINALAVVFMAVTIGAAILYVALSRRSSPA